MRSTRLFVVVLAMVGGVTAGSCGDNQSVPIDAAPDMGGLGTKCDDGIDNDGDGLVDYPADPGCSVPNADDETDDCPDGPACPQCANGRDDDGNGSTDYPDDPGCTAASDTTEVIDNPVACGASLMIKNLPANGMDSGTLDSSSTSQITTTCSSSTNVSAIAYRLNLSQPTTIIASTAGSAFDTVLDLRSADCDDPASEIACHDNVSTTVKTSLLQKAVPAGNYYLIVSGYDTASFGAYTLNVQRFLGEGVACTMTQQCGPGFVCRAANGGTATVCALPQCADIYDDDGDTKNGYPADPGCSSPSDNDELDDCPSGPNCPACANGTDDDNDTLTDYPADTSCSSAGSTSEACNGEQDPIVNITGALTQSTLVGARDNHNPSCGGENGVDVLFTLTVPTMRTITIDTDNSVMPDTLLSLLPSTCAEPSIECDDDDGSTQQSSLITRANLAAGTYIVAVDNYSDSSSKPVGAFNVNVRGVIAPGGSCEPALTLGGALACPATNPCEGTAGSMKCRPNACGDGMDNDSDTKTDFPADPGCASIDDNDEDDTCGSGPGPGCPECADGIDNDNDGDPDLTDTNCLFPSTASEGCVASEGVTPLVTNGIDGTTVGAVNDLTPTCGSSSPNAPDRTYSVELPPMRNVTFSAEPTSFDAAVSLLDSTCSGAPIACSDTPETITRTNLPGGTYYFVVDGWSSGSGTYTVSVSGQIQNGASCESPLFGPDGLRCADGFTCRGNPGSRTCSRAACADGLDNDTDGIADFPNDPGCASITDDDESDMCPGPSCTQQCADGLDNDSDGFTDYPNDPSCASASASSEYCDAPDGLQTLVLPVTPGTTGTATSEFAPTCGASTNTAGDRLYEITVPAMDSLTIANSNSFDAVVALYDATCGPTEIDCSDTPEDLTFTNLAAGTYHYLVDGYSDTDDQGTYTITISGSISTNASCEGPLALSGAITCGAGSVCSGTMGSRTCKPTLCNNGMDDDSDGKTDYPNDPGCDSPSDNDEMDPATAPVCSNGMDDDNDQLTDYPADFGCVAASGTSEAAFCTTETNPIELITMNPMTGTTTGLTNNFSSTTCISSSGEDKVLALRLPVPVTSLTLDLSGSPFDTVMQLRNSACSTQLACADDGGTGSSSKFTVSNLAAGTYAVVIDGWSGQDGAYTLTTTGVVAAGTSCASPLFAAGILACPNGTTCTGTPATCQ